MLAGVFAAGVIASFASVVPLCALHSCKLCDANEVARSDPDDSPQYLGRV